MVEDAVCVLLITEKLDVSQPTATRHLKILLEAKLVKAKRIGKWTFISRNEGRIAKLKKAMTNL